MLSLQIHSALLWRSGMNPAHTEGEASDRLEPNCWKFDIHVLANKHIFCNDSSNVVVKHLEQGYCAL